MGKQQQELLPTPPRLADRLITWLVPDRHADCLLGDLYEEYQLRFKENPALAKRWFWQQSLFSACGYIKTGCQHPFVLQTLIVTFATVAFISISLLVLWLSQMDHLDDFSPGFWQKLLNGNVHLALLEPAFWSSVPEYVYAPNENGFIGKLDMFVNMPSLFISVAFCAAMSWVSHNFRLSKLTFVLVGFCLIFLPYSVGFIMLSTNEYEATQVGPILAVMLLSFQYMLVPICWLICKRLRVLKDN